MRTQHYKESSVSLLGHHNSLAKYSMPSTQIVLTQNFPKSILLDAQSLSEVTKSLKDEYSLSNDFLYAEDRGLFWYIDSQSKPKIVQIGKRNLTNIDPLQCIVGVWVL